MCGLVLALHPKGLSKKHEDVLEDLLVVDSLRVKDSTGVAFIKSTGDVSLLKKTLLPQDLMDLGQYTRAKLGVNKLAIGHNRATSVGNTSNANAHPFEFDNLVGAHNGTLIGWKYAHQGLKDASQYDVDSECLYHNISLFGIDETWKVVDGSAALIWYDKIAGTANLLRNAQRPLSMTHTEDGVLFAASESWMLSVCLGRNGIKHGEIIDIAPNKLVSVTLDMQITVRELEAKKFTAVGTANIGATKPALAYGANNVTSNEEITFEVVTLVQAAKNSSVYKVEGDSLSTSKKEKVSFYVDANKYFNLYKRLKDSINSFVGTAMYKNPKNGYYLQVSTIVELEDFEPSDVPKDDSCTCSWCGDAVNKEVAKQISPEEYICAGCIDLPDVVYYLSDYIKREA